MALGWRTPLLLLLGAVPVVLWPGYATVWLWVLLVLLLVLLDLALAPGPGTLRVERQTTAPVRAGDETVSTLRVEAPRGLHGVLRDAWVPSAGARDNRHPLRLRRSGSVELHTSLRPIRRGTRHTDLLTVRSFGPLRLAARQRSSEVPGTVRVLPSFPSRRHLPSRLSRLRELDGRAAVRVRGQGTEFDSLREYVHGDDLRSIDPRASARSRALMVRTWQPERDRRVVVVLDTGRTSAARLDDLPRLDAAMDATLLLTALAARAGDRVDLVAGDRVVRSRVKGTHRGDALGRVQDALTDLEPTLAETDWHQLASAVAELGRQHALVVLLSPLEQFSVEHGLLPVLAPLVARHRVVLASVADPRVERMARERRDVAQVFTAAAAERAREQRERTARLLSALGVEVLEESSEQLPVALADHYLSLKARGLL